MWNKNLKHSKMKNNHLKIQYKNNPMHLKHSYAHMNSKIELTMNLKSKQVPNVGRLKGHAMTQMNFELRASKVDYKHKYNFKLWP
jgi:hypothetical protein